MNILLIVIIAVTVLISYKGFNDLSFFRKLEFHVGSILKGEQIRMISSGFLHVDMGHLFFNMVTLWFFAPLVLAYLGNWTFVLVYMGSLIFGNLLTLLFILDFCLTIHVLFLLEPYEWFVLNFDLRIWKCS